MVLGRTIYCSSRKFIAMDREDKIIMVVSICIGSRNKHPLETKISFSNSQCDNACF